MERPSFSQAVRRAARPVVRPLIDPFFRRVEGRVGPVDHRLAEAEARLAEMTSGETADGAVDRVGRMERELSRLAPAAGVADNLPYLLNAISTQNATARLLRRELDELREQLGDRGGETIAAAVDRRLRDAIEPQLAELVDAKVREALGTHLAAASTESAARLDTLQVNLDAALRQIEWIGQRVEFVRLELMYTLRYEGGREPASRDAAARPSEPVDPTTLPCPLRLNVGAGHIPREGYVNVDGRNLPGIDIVADARSIPLPGGCVAELRSEHLVEHFPEAELRRVVLPHWRELLEPGGTVSIVVPDAESMLAAHAAGEMSFDDLSRVTYGDQEYDGDFHFAMYSPARLEEALEQAGFEGAECIARGRRNGACLEMEIVARAPRAAVRGLRAVGREHGADLTADKAR